MWKKIYTFWTNTEAYPELDTNIVNKDIYIRILNGIEQMIKKFCYKADAVAVELETNLVYQKDRTEMIKKSENINAWSFDKSIVIDDLLEFSCSRVKDRNIYIYTGK